MNSNEYFRLAKLSLASRKSTTKSTIRGITFGLILLIPVIFIALGLYGDINSKVNKNPNLLYAQLTVASERSGQEDMFIDNYYLTISNKHALNLIKDVKIEDMLYYEQITSPYLAGNMTLNPSGSSKAFSFSVEGSAAQTLYKNNNSTVYMNGLPPFAAILDMEKTNSATFIPKKVTDRFKNVYVKDLNQGFTGDGKGQVILSEIFVKSLGKTAQEMYKKKFTLSYTESNGNMYIDKDNNPDNDIYSEISGYDVSKNVNFCYEYEVVGIIKEAVTTYAQTAFISQYEEPYNIMTNMMFFTKSSSIMPDGTALEPTITKYTQDGSQNDDSNSLSATFLATYKLQDNEFETLNKEYMCLGANGFNSFYKKNNYDNKYYSQKTLFLDAKDYEQLDNAISATAKELSSFITINTRQNVINLCGSGLYVQLSTLYLIFSYLLLFLSVMGGIIFFAAMVNLFNSIVHSIDTRKHYLGIMRAIGAKNSTIPKLYLAESITIFKRSIIWIVIFSGLICTGVKFGLDSAFNYINSAEFFPIPISISFWYIPLSMIIGIFILLLLGFAFSYGCSAKVAKSPIMSVLSD